MTSPLQERLARARARLQHETPAIPRRDPDVAAPLSSGQARLWYLNQVEPDSAVYNVVSATLLLGALDMKLLQAAFNDVATRHDILRTRLTLVAGAPVQQVDAATPEIVFDDLTGQPEDAVHTRLHACIMQPFELSAAGLLRLLVVRVAQERHILLIVAHHTILDGISMELLIKQLGERYGQRVQHADAPVTQAPEGALQYGDYAAWQQQWLLTDDASRQLAYWMAQHDGKDTVLDLPTDFPRPKEQSTAGASIQCQIIESELQPLEAFLARHKMSLFMGLVAALGILLARYGRQHAVNLGVPASGRSHPELENVLGFFANTLVLHLRTDPELTLPDYLARVRVLCLDSLQHQDLPFDRLVNAINPRRDFSRTPLYQVMFSFQDLRSRPLAFGPLRAEPYPTDIRVARTDLTFWMNRTDQGLAIALEYCTALFVPSTVDSLLEHLLSLLHRLPTLEGSLLREVDLRTPRDLAIQAQANDTQIRFSARDPVALVAASCMANADRIAVVDATNSFTYNALWRQSDLVYKALAELGVARGQPVGLYMERSANLIFGMLGIWRAGCHYIPLDPGFPDARLDYMVEKSGARYVLVDDTSPARDFPGARRVAMPARETATCSGELSPARPDSIDADGIAYIIFTSGSTGVPKGVMVPHRAVANFLQSMARRPGLTAEDSLLAVTTLSFDISVLELLLPLVVGGRVVIAGKNDTADGIALDRLLRNHAVSAMQATPATWSLLLNQEWRPAKGFKALCGGEPLPTGLAGRLLESGCELWNMYGPTETTVWSTCGQVGQGGQVISLGTPIANTQCFVVDAADVPCPTGVPGELIICGAGVTCGYVGEPAMTAERFFEFPVGSGQRQPAYRTGDVAVQKEDGTFQFLARTDGQIKLRGFRIEVGEIESALHQLPAIAAAVVTVRTLSETDKRLVAFIVFKGHATHTSTELRKLLLARLPHYMVPQQFVPLAQMPLTANGKVDRKALQGFELQAAATRTGELLTSTERRLADIWRAALGTDNIDPDQGFFDVGGHSLLSLSVINDVASAFGVRLGPREMMLNTLRQMAALIDQDAAVATPPEQGFLSRLRASWRRRFSAEADA